MPQGTYKFDLYKIDAETVGKTYPVGALSFIKPMRGKWVTGLAVYVPAGTGAKWNGAELLPLTATAYGSTQFEWESFNGIVTVAPIIAYKVSPKISIGATLNFDYGLLKLRRPGVGQYKEDLTCTTLGATFGVHARPTDKISVGMTLRTPSNLKFEGDATMAGLAALGLPTTAQATREATWPLWAGAGIAYRPTKKLTVTADAQLTAWSTIKEIPVTWDQAAWTAAAQNPSLAAGLNQKFVLNWKNTVQYRVGAEYAASAKWALRGGYYYDPSPSPDDTLNILLPESTYNVVNLGVGRKAGKLTIDACIEMLFGKKAESPLNGRMPGTHGMKLIVPNITLGYRF
jgi:long-chain fatty acid transport protein